MDEKNTAKVTEQDLKAAFSTGASKGAQPATKKDRRGPKLAKKYAFCLAGGIVGVAAGVACMLYGALGVKAEQGGVKFPDLAAESDETQVYSKLTGEVLESVDLQDAPAYCVQMPNGTDGARPQAGLTEAGVVFEAVAEAGITRFAAIYQNPTAAIIGPVRSLRIYYLEWDTPFDCTIVHAGGSGDALAAVSAGRYKDLSEDYAYMYRGTYGTRLWNNLFTTASYLKQFSADHGYNSSEIKGFARMTPQESAKARVDALAEAPLVITEPAGGDTSALKSGVNSVRLKFGNSATFNVNYAYDATENVYRRSYENGAEHEVYECAAENLGERNPEDVCTLTQVSPSVVVAMVVPEKRAADNYHEDITTTGTGKAYIFQNGIAIEGSWSKPSVADQIKFLDSDGAEIALAPGQTFISAIPSYGSIEY